MVLVDFIVHDFLDTPVRPPNTLSRNAHLDISKSLDGVSQLFCILWKNHDEELGITLSALFFQNLSLKNAREHHSIHRRENTHPSYIPMRNPRRRYPTRLRYVCK